MNPHSTSVSRIASLGHAMRGLACLVRTQTNARIHVLAMAGVVGLGAWLQVTWLEWAILSLACGLVLSAEALNTGIERVVDKASPEWSALARDAKDLAAAGVLIAAVAAALTGACIFGPKLWLLF